MQQNNLDVTQKEEKQGKAPLVWSALFLSLTLCLIGPMETFIQNSAELWFSAGDVVLVTLVVTAACFAAAFLVGLLFKRNWREYYICLLFGLALAFWLQGSFINADYGILNGTEPDWASYTGVGIVNTFIWAACIALPFVVRKIRHGLWVKAIKVLSVCILLVQIISVGTLAITTDLSDDRTSGTFISAENLSEVGSEDNVLIFILDTFDGQYMKEILENDREFMDSFEGFTCFTNTVGMEAYTQVAVPGLLSGQYFEYQEDWPNYAYNNTDYYKLLKDNGYDINMYLTSGSYLGNDFVGTGNVSNATMEKFYVTSYERMARGLYRTTFYRTFPHYAKPTLWFYNNWYNEIKGAEETENKEQYNGSNEAYKQYLEKNGLSVSKDAEKMFKVIHIAGTHLPHVTDENLNYVGPNAVPRYRTAEGILNIVLEYMDKMKETGTYDNTTIVLTADHGDLDLRQNVMLCIKPKNASGDFAVSNAPVSHTNVMATIFDDLGINDEGKYGRSAFDIGEDEHVERKYVYSAGSWNFSADDSEFLEYSYDENNNATLSDRVYTPYGAMTSGEFYRRKYGYTLGQRIAYPKTDTGQLNYFNNGVFNNGISPADGRDVPQSAYSFQSETKFVAYMEGVQEDVRATFYLDEVINGSQRVIVKDGGGNVLFDETLTEERDSFSFVYPAASLDNGLMVATVAYPDADPDKLYPDVWKYALGYAGFVIEKEE